MFRKVVLFICLLGSASSYAEQELARDFCSSIQQIRSNESYDAKAIFWRALKLRFFPGSYAKVQSLSFESTQQLSLSLDPSRLKNIVFFVGIPPEYRSRAELAQLQYQELEKEFKKYAKKIKKIARADTVEKCLIAVQKQNLDLVRFDELSRELESSVLADSKRLREMEQFERELKQIQGTLGRNWHVFKVSHLEDVRQWLSSYQIANAVIVTHGKSSGHLIDSFHNQYPNGFFANISPTLYSLSLYNCFGSSTSSTYDLENFFRNSPSMYKRRLLNLVKAPSENTRDQVAPLPGFSNFMRRVDRGLDQMNEDLSHHSGLAAAKQCQVRIAAQFSKGTPALALNRKFIGALKNEREVQTFIFPCDWQKVGDNLLTLTNISPTPWDLQHAPKLQINNLNPEIQVYRNSDSTLRSALYRF